MRDTRMNTASQYHSGFLGVTSSEAAAGIDTVEVAGSSPVVPTIFFNKIAAPKPKSGQFPFRFWYRHVVLRKVRLSGMTSKACDLSSASLGLHDGKSEAGTRFSVIDRFGQILACVCAFLMPVARTKRVLARRKHIVRCQICFEGGVIILEVDIRVHAAMSWYHQASA